TARLCGRPLTFGAIVRETASGITSMVGDDGQIYLRGLPLKGELFIQRGEGKNARCIAPNAQAEDSLKHAITISSATCIRP
ncbi:FimD/PapC C-terminal domain-containing protein, partial [Salmonella enterica]|uniref:FimD/PapC C-terminal domain-containing protein n=1 Tax=Salmonella enterica TaxID=28901 RepID=UPI001F37462C